jgi:hypothetical protein
MNNFNDLKQQLLSRISGAANMIELKKITSEVTDEFRSLVWSQPRLERKERNQATRQAHEKVWEERRNGR